MKQPDDENIFRLIYILKRLTDDWGEKVLRDQESSFPGFKTAYIAIFMSIGEEGISNKDIARELRISKMAASKIIRELARLDLIRVGKKESDGRYDMLFLSEKGRDFHARIKHIVNDLVDRYRQICGSGNYRITLDTLARLAAYHVEAAGQDAP